MNDRLPEVRPVSWWQIERLTNSIIKNLYPCCLEQPQAVPVDDFVAFDLAEYLSIILRVRSDLPVGVEGIVIPSIDGAPARLDLPVETYEGMLSGNPRDRFTAAHEAGHAVMHARQISEAYTSGKYKGWYRKKQEIPAFRDPECQANAFAARFLMPAPMVKLAITLIGLDVGRLARLFRVSDDAMRYRLRDMKAL